MLIAQESCGAGLTAILGQQHSFLVRRALFLTKDRDEALDLVQDTFERALRNRPGTLTQGSSVRSWLERILTNLFIDRWRHRKCSPVVARDVIEDVPATVAEPPPPWEHLSRADVDVAVARLPEPLRETFRLYYFEDVRYEDLCKRLNVPLGTVASRLLRARRRLRDLMLSQPGLGATATAADGP